jgi:flagellar hook protein FlgE
MTLTDNTGATDTTVFNNYMNYEITQRASGGELTTSQTLYDSQGNPHVVLYNFTLFNDNQNQWKLTMSANDPADILTLDPPFNNSEALVQFNSDGEFQHVATVPQPPTYNSTVAPLTFTLQPGNGATPMSNVSVNLGGTNDSHGGLILSAADATITYSDQDGYTIGSIENVSIDNSGQIIASYTNGEVRTIAQISLATFTNEQGLIKLGNSLFGITPNSGEAAIGRAGTGGRGDIIAGQLENSNVDLATEFVNLITIQRGYQANSRVITTSDEMLQELMNLKR